MNETSKSIRADIEDLMTATVDMRYPENIETIRMSEYPALKDTTYLDHAGTTLYAKSLIESYTAELTANIFGNPHSASSSSQLSSRRIEDVRLRVLQFVQADPNDFDIVFVANATAAIKLVADSFRDHEGGFWYGYHVDSHTSLVGVRELATLGSSCMPNDTAVENWILDLQNTNISAEKLILFAYPGQSNMTGRRLPDGWCGQIRAAAARKSLQAFTLFDAAAKASTSPLDFSNLDNAPDFTALSFYKIFGFPDMGALIVRKASGHVLGDRKYFAGGTVDMVSACGGLPWHMKKQTLHSALEDGTLPFHNIIALEHALKTHFSLYGSMSNISRHTSALSANLFDRISRLKHSNGTSVCKIYSKSPSDCSPSGPVIAFNLVDDEGRYISNMEVEKLGIVKNLQFRTGGLCNPGGIAQHLDLEAEDMQKNYAAGQRCGGGNDIIEGQPTGAIRVSLGAMSNQADVDAFIKFLEDFYVSHPTQPEATYTQATRNRSRFCIESMSVFPIKSCSAFKISADADWRVSSKGLAWDREWCLVHRGTNATLSQKQHPRMALIQPAIDVKRRLLIVTFRDNCQRKEIAISLDEYPSALGSLKTCRSLKRTESLVCGEVVPVHVYTLPEVNEFFSDVLGVPCVLARYFTSDTYSRLAKLRKPRSKSSILPEVTTTRPSIMLSNESPILLVSRSSVNQLNEHIRQNSASKQEILPESFRANIVVSEQRQGKESESPYVEDTWHTLAIGPSRSAAAFDVLGPCQRCQMVCVDQANAKRRQEPFSTLAKTRRWDGGVWFGVHLCLSGLDDSQWTTIRVGDAVVPA